MQSTIKRLPKSVVEIRVVAEHDDIADDLKRAAMELSSQRPIEGFRPGKAPYERVKTAYGEAAIYEAAMHDIVRRSYVKAVKEHDLHTFGEPSINVTKLAPGNPVEYTATVSLVPKVLKMADVRDITVDTYPAGAEDSDVDGTLKELQRMQTKEVAVERAAGEKDKIVVDMDMSKGGVPLDGGQTKDHGIYLDQEAYIPGLKEQMLGLGRDAEKTFSLRFPKDHYQKHLAGTDVDFRVKVKGVYELQHPELDDAFAKALGQENIGALRDLLRANIDKDKKDKEQQRMDNEVFEKLVDKSKFEDIPDDIVNIETNRMLSELKHSVNDRGVEFDQYLESIKKTLDELKLEMIPQAIKRVKTALLMREIAEKEGIAAEDGEVLEELQNLINAYSNDAKIQEQLRSEEYQDYLRTSIRNRKVVDFLRDNVRKKERKKK